MFDALPLGDPGIPVAQEGIDDATQAGEARDLAFKKALRALTHGKNQNQAKATGGGLLGAVVPQWVLRRHLAAMKDIVQSQRVVVSTSSRGLNSS